MVDLPWKTVGRFAAVGRSLLGSRTKDAIGILTYHRVIDPVDGLPAPEHNVAPGILRKQLLGLLKQGYEFWPLQKLLSARGNDQTIPRRVASVTYDDGYESVYHNAWPVHRELQIPATLFVSTAYLDTSASFPFDDWGTQYRYQLAPEAYRPLTTAQCSEMRQDGLFEIGAHTHSHQDFRDRPEEFAEDLKKSAEIVREKFSVSDVSFAFPYGCPYAGYAANDLVRSAEQVGVTCGLTSESIPVDLDRDPFHWGRFTVFPWDTGATLSAKIEGWYDWAPKLRRRVLRTLPWTAR